MTEWKWKIMEDFEELQTWIQKVGEEIDEKSIELAK